MRFSYNRETDEMTVTFNVQGFNHTETLIQMGVAILSATDEGEEVGNWYNEEWANDSHQEALDSVPKERTASPEVEAKTDAVLNAFAAVYGSEFVSE